MQTLATSFLTGVEGLSPWRQVAVIILVSAALATAIEIVARWWLKRYSGDGFPTVLFGLLHVPLYVSVLLGGVYAVVRLLDPPRIGFVLEATSLSLLVFLWAWASRRLGIEVIVRIRDTNAAYGFAPVLKNLWSVTVSFVAFAVLLSVWRVDLTPLLASAGVLGIVIGFAARDAIANFVGGIALFVDDTYKPGDFVVLDSGEKGTVVDIGLRSTTILTRDRVMVTVPNGVLNSTQVINESAPQRYKRMRVPIGVEYGADADRVEEILVGVLEAEKEIMDSPPPQVVFLGFGDSALQFELRGFIRHSNREPKARHLVNKRIHRRLREEDIEIPFPQRTVTYGDESAELVPEDELNGVGGGARTEK